MLRLAADPTLADIGVTAEEAARIIGCDRSRVYKLIRAGRLEGYNDGRAVRVYYSSIETYRQAGRIAPASGAAPRPAPRASMRNTARHREAVAALAALGIASRLPD